MSLLLLAACGSRLDGARILAESQGSQTVRLSQGSLDALRAAGDTDTAPQPDDVTSGTPTARPATPAGRSIGTTATTPLDRPAPTGTTGRSPTEVAAAQQARPAGSTTAGRCPPNLPPIKVGHVGPFSGIAGPITGSAPTTMAAWANDVNSRGGLACRKVKVLTRDDGGDPNRSAAIADDLIKREKVVAFVAPQVILSAAGFVPAVRAAKIPVIGGPPITDAWFSDPLFFPDGASPIDQVTGLLKQGVERGKAQVGAIYCVEATACTTVVRLVREGADRAGASFVWDSPVSITQPDYTAQCLNAQKAGVDQLVLAVDGASMNRIARSCAAVNYRPLLATAATAIGTSQSKDTTLRSFGVITANTTAPWTENDRPGLRDYHRALARWAPTMEPDGSSVSAWVSAKLFELGLTNVADRARAAAKTPVLLAGLGQVRNETLGGLAAPLTFRPGKPATSAGCVFYQLLGPDGWTAPRGSTPVCLKR